MSAEEFKIVGGTVRFGKSFKICYEGDAFLWKRNPSSLCALTVIKGPSGSGKTILLGELYKRLRRQLNDRPGINFSFPQGYDPLPAVSVAYISQNPPMVNHWRLNQVLPAKSIFLQNFFRDSEDPINLGESRMGHFSGGQRLKLYTCSALERLVEEDMNSSFLLMDETFDGLGAGEAGDCLSAIENAWKELRKVPLYLLLVTHLNYSELVSKGLAALKLELEVVRNSRTEIGIKVINR